ncbi:MAG: hypothetical protein GX903_11880 [Spirochaetales bacterium]|nr:hypothetical protein [Spirochaetales bacterium]
MYSYLLDHRVLFSDACKIYGIEILNNKKILLEALSKEDIEHYVVDNVERPVNDERSEIRLEVASAGFCLDRLITDRDYRVQKEAAKQKAILDKLTAHNVRYPY